MESEHKCPFCPKSFVTKWRLVNHIRQSRGAHGPMGDFPEGFDPSGDLSVIGNNLTASDPEDVMDESVNLNVEVINPPVKGKIDMLLCPDCNTPKTEWIAIRYAEDATEDEKRAYDYVCPNCGELIKLNDG